MDNHYTLSDILVELNHVDDPDVFERMKTKPALRPALETSRPENWWGTGLDPKKLFTIAKDDGIPVALVPSSKILLDIAGAPDHDTRMSILLDRKQEIISQCKEIIHRCDDPWVADMSKLAEKAITAYEDGHYEAAMALAVNIGEPLAIWASKPRCQFFKSKAEHEAWKKGRSQAGKYGWVAFELDTVDTELLLHEWLRMALIAPIHRFFTKWYPDTGEEPPEILSRHVIVHQPTLQHFSPENALLSLMLVTSLQYPMQEWSVEVREQDYFAEIQEQNYLADLG